MPKLCVLVEKLVILNKDFVDSSNLLFNYDSFKLVKSKTLPFPTHKNNVQNCFDLVHTNVLGKVSFSFSFSMSLHSKYDVFDVFKLFLAYVKNQFSTSIKVLRSNFKGE